MRWQRASTGPGTSGLGAKRSTTISPGPCSDFNGTALECLKARPMAGLAYNQSGPCEGPHYGRGCIVVGPVWYCIDGLAPKAREPRRQPPGFFFDQSKLRNTPI